MILVLRLHVMLSPGIEHHFVGHVLDSRSPISGSERLYRVSFNFDQTTIDLFGKFSSESNMHTVRGCICVHIL